MDCVPSVHDRCENYALPGALPSDRASVACQQHKRNRGRCSFPSSCPSSCPPLLSFSSDSSARTSTQAQVRATPVTDDTGANAGANAESFVRLDAVAAADIAFSAADADRTRINTLQSDENTSTTADARETEPARTVYVPDLPPFRESSTRNFTWGSLDGDDFANVLHSAYCEVVHWRRNLFLVPSGSIGKKFVRELTRLFNEYAQASALESVALEAIMVASCLLLQKPHKSSKSREHVSALERRLNAWESGDIDGLLREGRAIQNHLAKGYPKTTGEQEEKHARVFSKLMLEGKTRAALRYLSDNQRHGLLDLDQLCGEKTVQEVLQEKHPAAGPVQRDALVLNGDIETPPFHSVLFDKINADAVRSSALRTQGSAGPSGIDAAGWRRLVASFHRESKDLCSAIAGFARRLCTECVDPEGIRAYVACRLVPLNKNPGVRPIGICEVLRRIVGKVVMSVVGDDVLSATGPIQLCAGHEAGAEAAVHAMSALFQDEGTDAVILVDASNAFNNLNRRVALLNITLLCPAIATILINCYRGEAPLFVAGTTILSKEGTTQGDPLAMAMFALASMPLIRRISTNGATQAWFADDAACGGKLVRIRHWWDRLVCCGPQHGYYPNAVKTIVIAKEHTKEEAESAFKETGVEITSVGSRYLGGAVGKKSFLEKFVQEKVSSWTMDIEQLSTFAKTQPHAAFAAFTHGLCHCWTYLTRVMPIEDHLLEPIEKSIREKFLPALTSQAPCNDQVRNLLSLPPRHGGLGISKPRTTQHSASVTICKPLVDAILNQEGKALEIRAQQRQLKNEQRKKQRIADKDAATELTGVLQPRLQRSILAASEKGASAWLTTMPIERHGFALHKGAFRDAIALRYGWSLEFCPSSCACGAQFDTEHLLTCSQGGYISLRHNELRDLTADLMKDVCSDVITEPQLQPVTDEHLPPSTNKDCEARLDVRARGFWNGSNEAFFDVRVFHPFASSYRNSSLAAIYRQHEKKKKREYSHRVREIEKGSFTPLVFSTTGGMGREATVVFQRLASLISDKTGDSYSVVLGWMRSRVSFSLLRSALLCLRGSHTKRHRSDTNIALASVEGRI